MPPPLTRRQFAALQVPLTILGWAIVRTIFGHFHGPVAPALMDLLVMFVLVVGGGSITVGSLFQSAQRAWMLPAGMVNLLTGLTILLFKRHDQAWVVLAVVALCIWGVLLRAAIWGPGSKRPPR